MQDLFGASISNYSQRRRKSSSLSVRQLNEAMRRLRLQGLTMGQLQTLTALGLGAGTKADLCIRTGMSHPAVANAVQYLVDTGDAAKIGDKVVKGNHAHIYALTDQGLSLIQKVTK